MQRSKLIVSIRNSRDILFKLNNLTTSSLEWYFKECHIKLDLYFVD